MRDGFLGGVVEGFYGQPWTHQQRLTLFDQLAEWGMNTYFYAPKDDLKHRAVWRQPYENLELGQMEALVAASQKRQLRFIYGLSPGLDIGFTNASDLQCLKQRLQQMIDIGVRHFALLFDDLPGSMRPEDCARFSSVASAQASVANATLQWLKMCTDTSRLLFCPTPYCDRMDKGDLGGKGYLDVLGAELAADIDVLWTGPEIISADIPTHSIDRLASRIKRQPVIWDNLQANDYDLRRLYCGPYNRSRELLSHVRGILLNPNNEFSINFVPLRTLGQYLNRSDYQPRSAYLDAIREWAAHYQTVDFRIAVDDLVLLGDCYYLPHSEGEEAERLQHLADVLLSRPVEHWEASFDEFLVAHRRIGRLFEWLTQLQDRDLFYAWSRRVWELREELDLIKDFVQAKRQGLLESEAFASETHLPLTYRGGMVARLQRKLTMGSDARFRRR